MRGLVTLFIESPSYLLIFFNKLKKEGNNVVSSFSWKCVRVHARTPKSEQSPRDANTPSWTRNCPLLLTELGDPSFKPTFLILIL
jgi:hypothetical protein